MTEPDLTLLIALDALLAEGSVAKASRRLGLSDSAMSRTLARLRAVTNDPLLVRAGRGMVLTPYAEALRGRTRDIVHEALAMLRPAVSESEVTSLHRTFTIRANDGFVEAFGAVLIAEAAREAPRVSLRFAPKAEKTSTYLREGLADLEIGVVADMGPEVRVQALFRDRFVGVVRRGHPLAAKKSVTPQHYVAFGHVVASRTGRTAGPVDDALAALDMKRHIAAVVPSFPAVLAVVRTSDLVGLVPASFVDAISRLEDHAGPRAIHAFGLPVETPGITVSQMWHPRLDGDAAHRWLRKLVLGACRGDAPLV
jgi:DNA-binding transcriptional LysR family regulator